MPVSQTGRIRHPPSMREGEKLGIDGTPQILWMASASPQAPSPPRPSGIHRSASLKADGIFLPARTG